MEVKTVLGVPVDLIGRQEMLGLISDWLAAPRRSTRVVVTAYSEFFVRASSDKDFRMALEDADLVIPDGIGPLAAIYFKGSLAPSDNFWEKLFKGVKTGRAILAGKVGRPVAGYDLFKELTLKAAEKGWRVFLLGGFADVAARLAEKIRAGQPGIQVEFDAGAQRLEEMKGEPNEKVIEKINRFKPDLLFVAYGPGKQEKWLSKYREDLKAKTAVGVGGAFDEALGLVKEAPEAWSRLGLKWLWRLIQQPQRIGRIWRAVVVFPWLVFREK